MTEQCQCKPMGDKNTIYEPGKEAGRVKKAKEKENHRGLCPNVGEKREVCVSDEDCVSSQTSQQGTTTAPAGTFLQRHSKRCIGNIISFNASKVEKINIRQSNAAQSVIFVYKKKFRLSIVNFDLRLTLRFWCILSIRLYINYYYQFIYYYYY